MGVKYPEDVVRIVEDSLSEFFSGGSEDIEGERIFSENMKLTPQAPHLPRPKAGKELPDLFEESEFPDYEW